MKATLIAALLLPIAAAAAESQPIVVSASQMTPLQQRYCAKLHEGVLPYVQFVRRTKPIYGYTYTDFAPDYPGAPVAADCRLNAQRVAEVHAYLKLAASEPAQR